MKRQTYFDGKSYQPLSSKVECVQALGKLEDAEGQGRLLWVPCSIGDKIYYIGFGHICEYEVECIDIHKDKLWIVIEICYEDRHGFWSDEFGETIFLSKEEAVKALEVQKLSMI